MFKNHFKHSTLYKNRKYALRKKRVYPLSNLHKLSYKFYNKYNQPIRLVVEYEELFNKYRGTLYSNWTSEVIVK